MPDKFLWLLNYERYAHACVSFRYIFSFTPVILASIHRYVSNSDIQVLMMVTNTETFNVDLTS